MFFHLIDKEGKGNLKLKELQTAIYELGLTNDEQFL